MQEKLLIIYTGGTIGMQQSPQGYIPTKNLEKLLDDHLSESDKAQLSPYDIVEFDPLIDSSNAQPADWLSLAQCIDKNKDNYKGFIVLHGTDTMAYSAAATHHLLKGLNQPIIFTGSQIPLSQNRSDGASNLINAAHFARHKDTPAVASICFNGKLLHALHATKVDSKALGAFDSPNHTPLATANIDVVFSPAIEQEKQQTVFSLNEIANGAVSILFLFPGIANHCIDAVFEDTKTRAVVLLSFGAGNPPDKNQHLMQTMKNARERGITIVNMSQCYAGGVAQDTYAVGSSLSKLGVISGGKRTLEDVVTDLYIHPNKYTPEH